MKKLLALVLALVMVMSLCITSNAAYSDAADIDFDEAVDVMSAVGVFVGADGKFSPKDELTREQAAKLVAYLDLGEKVAEALPAVKVFNDVAADRWSAKYVAYCADAGYIVGLGDGNFDPAGKLTGYAFGKMLLCVLGYDAAIEGISGSNWTLAVAKLMQSNDIAKGVDGSASANLTREQAAQYCLNALKATMVEYASKGTNITINGAVIATGASKAEAVTVKASNTKNAYAGAIDGTLGANEADVTVQLGEKLYDGDLVYGPATTDFGFTGKSWTYNNKDYDNDGSKVIGKYSTATVIASYTTASDVTYGDLYKLGTWTTATSIDIDENKVDGGEDLNVSNITKGNASKAFSSSFDGAVLYVLDQDGDGTIDDVQVTYGYLAKVKSVSKATKTTDRSVTLTVYGDATGQDITYTTEEFEKGDYVVAYPATDIGTALTSATDLIDVVAAEKVSGETTAVSGTTSAYTKLTVAGTSYSVAATAKVKPAVTVAKTNRTTVDAYLLNGYILGVDITSGAATADLGDVVYLVDNVGAPAVNASGDTVRYAKIVHMNDGSYEVINSDDASFNSAAVGFFVLSKNSDDDYVLTAATDTTAAKLGTKVGNVSAADTKAYLATGTLKQATDLKTTTKAVTLTESDTKAYLTANTVYVFRKGTTTSATVGGINLASANPTGVLVSYNSTDKAYEVAAMFFDAATYAETVDSNIVYVKSSSTGVNDLGEVYTAYLTDGTKTTVTVKASTNLTGLVDKWTTYTVDADGLYTIREINDTSDTYERVFSTKAASVYGSALTIADTIEDLDASDVVIVNLIAADATGADIGSIADMAAMTSVTGALYVVDKAVTVIVITAAA